MQSHSDAEHLLAMESNQVKSHIVWRRRFCFLAVAWIGTTVLMSFPAIRGVVAWPLYVHDGDAHGDVAYVMANGHATWERLRAAADLYHEKRVPRIMILDEPEPAGFNYVRGKLDTRARRSIDFLIACGVPEERISVVPRDSTSWMSSLGEARDFARQEPDIERMVVVTSAPHTRRSRMCFRRVLNDEATVQVYAASDPSNSAENSAPTWLEYAKLVVYFLAAN